MKTMKKLLVIVTALALILALAVPALATDPTGTITLSNASIGKTYELYKLFDATYNADALTTAYTTKNATLATALAAVQDSGAAVFTVGTADSDGNIAVSVVSGKETAALTWIKANAETYGTKIGDTVTAASNTLTWTVPYGYYYIKSSLGTTLTINSNTPSMTVIDKNTTAPTVPEGGAKSAGSTNCSIGDTVSFTVTFTATNFVTDDTPDTPTSKKITKYIVTDTATGFKLNSDVVVKVNGTAISAANAFDSDGKLELAWTNASTGDSLYPVPSTVVITYTGVMTAAAKDGSANNTAIISYVTESGTTPINPDDPGVDVETYSFALSKVDGADTTKKLSGAEFHLYDAATEGNEIALVKDSDTVYHVADADEKAATGFTPAVIVAGDVTIKGLAAGTYYLEETKAPGGYNMLETRAPVTVAATGTNSVTVENNAGIALPHTGGEGTTLLLALGSVLFLATALVLITKKRMYNEGC